MLNLILLITWWQRLLTRTTNTTMQSHPKIVIEKWHSAILAPKP